MLSSGQLAVFKKLVSMSYHYLAAILYYACFPFRYFPVALTDKCKLFNVGDFFTSVDYHIKEY